MRLRSCIYFQPSDICQKISCELTEPMNVAGKEQKSAKIFEFCENQCLVYSTAYSCPRAEEIGCNYVYMRVVAGERPHQNHRFWAPIITDFGGKENRRNKRFTIVNNTDIKL